MLIDTSKKLVLKLKFDEEKTLGISKKITNGFVTMLLLNKVKYLIAIYLSPKK